MVISASKLWVCPESCGNRMRFVVRHESSGWNNFRGGVQRRLAQSGKDAAQVGQ